MPGVQELPRVPAPADEIFRRDWLRPRRPVVLTGVTAEWLPPARWTFEHMAARWGSARVVTAALAGGTLLEEPASGVVFRQLPLGEVVASFARPGPAPHYVMAPTANFPPDFQRDYRVPSYCAGARHLRVKVWLGKAGTVTPLHQDVPHNLHVHLTGRKRWLLFAPEHSARLYRRTLLSGMPNFARVDPERPDAARFPRFQDVPAFGATLGPGETLFIPHGWWHHTRSLDDTVAMNFWWGGAVVSLAALASTAWKRVRRIRQGEWAGQTPA